MKLARIRKSSIAKCPYTHKEFVLWQKLSLFTQEVPVTKLKDMHFAFSTAHINKMKFPWKSTDPMGAVQWEVPSSHSEVSSNSSNGSKFLI